MKTNLFLIWKYWRRHKMQFAKIAAAVMFLTALVTTSLLIERTELRRELQGYQYQNGLGSVVRGGFLTDSGHFIQSSVITGEQLEILRNDERVERVGQAAVFGKIGDDQRQYIYGAYFDDNARELENLELLAGRFPERSGEAAIHDYIAENLFYEFEPANAIGREITLDLFDFDGDTNRTGAKTGELSIEIVGVIKSSSNPGRPDKEYHQFFDTGIKKFATPTVYLYHGDVGFSESFRTFAYIEYAGADVYTEDFYNNYSEFSKEMLENGLLVEQNAQARSVSSLVDFAYQSEDVDTKIYPSDTTTAIRYFGVLAVVISSIALFGVLYPILTARERSLDTMRKIGGSKRRKNLILLTEALIFLIVGTLAGFVLSAGVYELILALQKSLLGLPALRAYTAEWGVEKVSQNPFATAAILSAAVLIFGYLIYLASRIKRGKKLPKKNAKPRSLRILFGRISGTRLSDIIQGLLVCSVIFTCTFGYCYSTTNGKGNSPWFRSDEFDGDSFFAVGNLDLREIDADAVIYSLSSGAESIRVDRNTGITPDEEQRISGLSGVADVRAFARREGFSLVYPNTSKEIPAALLGTELEWLDGAEKVLPIFDYNYYETAAFFLNDTALADLKNYVTDGELGQYKNGVAEIIFDGEEPSYKVGETLQTISIDNQYNADVDIFEREAVVEAIVTLPESARESSPAMYALFESAGSGRGIVFAAPQANTEAISPLKTNYDYTIIKYADSADEAELFSEIMQTVQSDQALKFSTLSGARKAYYKNLAARFASVISIIAVIFLMMTLGFYSIIQTRLESGRKSFATVRALGLPRKKYKKIFALYTLRNTVFGCLGGAALSYLAQWLLRLRERKCLSMLGADGSYSTFGLDELQMAYLNGSEHYLLLNYEMQYVPIFGILALLSGALIILSAIFTFGVFAKRGGSIAEQTKLN